MWKETPSVLCAGVLHVCVCMCVCLCALILVFRGAPLSILTCVNTPADQMADNDFQIDTLHSTGGENQWALIAFSQDDHLRPKATIYLSLLFYLLLLSLAHTLSPIHSPLNTTEIDSNHAAFHRGFTAEGYSEISLQDDQMSDTQPASLTLSEWMHFSSGLMIPNIYKRLFLLFPTEISLFSQFHVHPDASCAVDVWFSCAALLVNGKMRGAHMNSDL